MPPKTQPPMTTTPVEAWVFKRSPMLALCMNNANVNQMMQLAIREDWTVEKFLEITVLLLGRINGGLVNDILDYRLKNPEPIVIGSQTYRYTHPEELHGNLSDPEGPLRG